MNLPRRLVNDRRFMHLHTRLPPHWLGVSSRRNSFNSQIFRAGSVLYRGVSKTSQQAARRTCRFVVAGVDIVVRRANFSLKKQSVATTTLLSNAARGCVCWLRSRIEIKRLRYEQSPSSPHGDWNRPKTINVSKKRATFIDTLASDASPNDLSRLRARECGNRFANVMPQDGGMVDTVHSDVRGSAALKLSKGILRATSSMRSVASGSCNMRFAPSRSHKNAACLSNAVRSDSLRRTQVP
jgi:hypothetical protein